MVEANPRVESGAREPLAPAGTSSGGVQAAEDAVGQSWEGPGWVALASGLKWGWEGRGGGGISKAAGVWGGYQQGGGQADSGSSTS